MSTYTFKPCPRCGKDEWFNMPCSLANVCTDCGFVLVGGSPEHARPGATIQEWAADLYAASQKRDEASDSKS